jgi:hypothetical protein
VITASTDVSCHGEADGTATVSGYGGNGGYTYEWSDGQTTSLATGLSVGQYQVTVTVGGVTGCSAVALATITEPDLLIADITNSINVSCYGLSNGSAKVVATGGTIVYSYLWSNSQTTATAANLTVGTYTVTVTDAHGCKATASVAITQPSEVTAFAGGDATICKGSSYLLADAGAINYTSLTWSTSGDGYFNNSASLNPIYTPGSADIVLGQVTLTLTAHCVQGCSPIVSSMTLTIQKSPVANAGPDATICETSTYCLCTATASTYTSITWESLTSINPKVLGTGSFSNINAVNPVYTPSQADINAGCVYLIMHLEAASPCTAVTDTMKLCISRVPVANAGADAMICEGFGYTISDATATYQTGLKWVTSGTGTFSPNAGSVNPTYTPSTADINAGSVTLTMRLTACSPCPNASDAMVLTIHRNPSATASVVSNVSCYGLSDGVVTVSVSGGTTPYSYLWSNSASTQTVSGLSIGTYSVTVTDNFGCTKTSETTVSQPTLLTVSGIVAQHVQCKFSNEGAITITATGGTTAYSYLWSNNATTKDISGLTAGTYTVTVTDNHSCTTTDDWTVTEPDLLTVGGTVTNNVVCNGGNEGSITITAGGGITAYSYLWSNNSSATTISGLTSGTYSVTVTDAHSCSTTGSWTVTQPEALTLSSYVKHNVLCTTSNEGAIYLTITGGTTAYGYKWSNNETTSNITGLIAGSYSVTVTDAHSCSITENWTITEPDVLTINNSVTHQVLCNGSNEGSVAISVIGGTLPYAYTWSNGTTTQNVSGLTAGVYSVTVLDANSCHTHGTWIITEPDVLTLNGSVLHNVNCNGGNDGSIDISTAGGTTAYTYSWSNGATSQNLSVLTAGTYSLIVTDAHSCFVTDSWTVTEPNTLTISNAVKNDILCNGGNGGSISLTVSGGTTAYSYTWSNTATSQNVSSLTAGTYSVTVTDANSCSTTGSWTISEPPALSMNGVTVPTCYSTNNGAINVTYQGGSSPYTYLWSNSYTTASISGLYAGTYTVTVTDAHSCTLSGSWTVTQNPEWSIGITGPVGVCCTPGGTPATYCATIGGTYTSPVTYQWVIEGGTICAGANTPCIDVLWSCCGQGTVTLIATNADGCVLTTITTVSVSTAPSPVITGPSMVTVGQTGTVFCTPDVTGHLFSWNVTGGTITAGAGTNCITVTWGTSCSNCNGSVTVYETYNGCTGSATMPVTIMPGEGNLSGYVTYNNQYGTSLNGVVLTLRNTATGTIVGSTTSGINTANNQPGYYTFSTVPNGTYRLTGSYNGTWGGNNATDALIVQLNVINTYPLAYLKDTVADVNASHTKSALDALYIKLRTVGSINSYPAGDWKVTDTTFTLFGLATNVNLKALCVGDVNGSFIPVGYKASSTLSVIEDGVMTVPVGEPFVYTIHSGKEAELGAMTLFMNYDESRFEIMDIASSIEGMKYVFGDGKISIAWADTKPLKVNRDDLILSLNMRAKVKMTEPTSIFSLAEGCEFADVLAKPYDDYGLKMTNVISPEGSMEFSMYNYPNPFVNNTSIVYNLPEAGHVKLLLTDVNGKTIRTLVDDANDAGFHKVLVDPAQLNMAAGVYFYRIIFESDSDSFTKVNKMVLTR